MNKFHDYLFQLTQIRIIAPNLSLDLFLLPLIFYRISSLLYISNSFLHISLIAAILQLFLIENIFLFIFPSIFLIIFYQSYEPPIFSLLCVIIYVIFANIGFGNLKTSEICIISQIITSLVYIDDRLDYGNYTFVFMQKLTLKIIFIIISFSIFLYFFKSVNLALMISKMIGYTLIDWTLTGKLGITPFEWVIFQIWDNIYVFIIWGAIGFFFISLICLKLWFKRDDIVASSMRKDFHFLLSSIIITSLYLNKIELVMLALDALLVIFLLVEMARFTKFAIITDTLQYLRIFYNERDRGDLLFIHIFLVLGLIVPLIVCLVLDKGGMFDKWIMGCMGVYAIGISDSLASIIGGSIKSPTLPLSNSKTIGGSLTFFLALFSCLAVSTRVYYCYNIIKVLTIAIIGTIYEGYSDSADNLTVPLATVAVLLFLENGQ